MANTKSAKKRIRQNVKRRAINRWRKSEIKDAINNFEDVLKTGDQAKMQEALSLCFKKLDTVAAKGTIHKNMASRKKARLAKKMNKVLSK